MFADKGVTEVLVHHIGCEGLFLNNCASLLLEVKESGEPDRLVNFWSTLSI